MKVPLNPKLWLTTFALILFWLNSALGQTPPAQAEIAKFGALHRAANSGDVTEIGKLIADGANVDSQNEKQRTAVHVAAFASNENALKALAKAGADLNALEYQKYDIVTIAAVANDPEFLRTALQLGANPGNTTSIYDGTALIAAAHLGHHEVVQILIDAGAPLDHINNLQWTALIESVVLGDGGENHVKTAQALVNAGADKSIGDRDGVTPLEHARQRGYAEMIEVLSK